MTVLDVQLFAGLLRLGSEKRRQWARSPPTCFGVECAEHRDNGNAQLPISSNTKRQKTKTTDRGRKPNFIRGCDLAGHVVVTYLSSQRCRRSFCHELGHSQ
eukprot:336755-Amphidinium_carterae.1